MFVTTHLHAQSSNPGHHVVTPIATIACPIAPELVRHLRNFVRDCTLGLGASAGTASTAQLLTSELVSNSVRHTPPGTLVRLEVLRDETCDLLLVTVEDADRTLPTLTNPSPPHAAESGWGLPLVALLAEEYGVTPVPVAGKRVWFTLKLA